MTHPGRFADIDGDLKPGATVGTGATIFAVAQRVFTRRVLDRHETRMAVTETLAHLQYLADHGRLRRQDGEVWWFEPVS